MFYESTVLSRCSLLDCECVHLCTCVAFFPLSDTEERIGGVSPYAALGEVSNQSIYTLGSKLVP